MNHFYPHSGEHLFYRKRIEWLFLRLKVMEQDPLFVHLTAPTIVYATPRSSTTWQFVVVALVLLIFCTLNLTCSRRSDISREYGAKRRGAKKKQNTTQHLFGLQTELFSMHVLHQKNFCQFGRKNCDCFIAFGMTTARKQQPSSCFAAARREGN